MFDSAAISAQTTPVTMLHLQYSILNRFSRPERTLPPVVFEATQNVALIYQYFRLRGTLYPFTVQPSAACADKHDDISHIMVAHRGNLCMGGLRLTVREPDESWPLPMEARGYNLYAAFPNVAKMRHAEISRIALLADRNDEAVLAGLVKCVHEKSAALGVQMIFAKLPLSLARRFKAAALAAGQSDVRILKLALPEDEAQPEVKNYLVVCALPAAQPSEKSQSAELAHVD